MPNVVKTVKSRKAALLRLIKASKLICEFRQLTFKQLSSVFIFAYISNYQKSKYQQSYSLAIASTAIVLSWQNLYQQYFATVKQTW
jgi:hypothetical protein